MTTKKTKRYVLDEISDGRGFRIVDMMDESPTQFVRERSEAQRITKLRNEMERARLRHAAKQGGAAT